MAVKIEYILGFGLSKHQLVRICLRPKNSNSLVMGRTCQTCLQYQRALLSNGCCRLLQQLHPTFLLPFALAKGMFCDDPEAKAETRRQKEEVPAIEIDPVALDRKIFMLFGFLFGLL
mmetsp:Transcript_19323/g.41582  ORF Transcript_19323/g.41582 Transcript_19323/m.41582 type:complete len:117 (+) Transcript_19323:1112-1462(+)